jgi:hypothetical protein
MALFELDFIIRVTRYSVPPSKMPSVRRPNCDASGDDA